MLSLSIYQFAFMQSHFIYQRKLSKKKIKDQRNYTPFMFLRLSISSLILSLIEGWVQGDILRFIASFMKISMTLSHIIKISWYFSFFFQRTIFILLYNQGLHAFTRFVFQLISELVILSIRPEDEGVFYCSAENPAGVARANFTITVIDNGESLILSAQDKNQQTSGSSLGGDHIHIVEDSESSSMFKVSCVFFI